MFRTMIDGLDSVPTGEYAWGYVKYTAENAPIKAQYWVDPMGYVYPVDWHHTSAPQLVIRYFGKDKLSALQEKNIDPIDFLEGNRWTHVSFIGIFGDYTQRGYDALRTLHKRMSEANLRPHSREWNTLRRISAYVS